MKFWQKLIKYQIIPVLLIVAAGVLAVASMWKDSAVRDEMPHIVAGYSYITQLDYRINPEHPPLVKELAGFPLIFQNVYFPINDPSWKDSVNDQWTLGDKFLYKYGNDADEMLFWGRFPVVLIFLLGGWILYRWSEKITGKRELALVALILYLFSPNLMAHGRFITTDMGATAFAIFALYAYYLYLENPNWKNFLWAGVVFALAQLAKFSLFLLIPTFLFIAFIYGLGIYRKGKFNITLKEIGIQLGKACGIMIIGYLIVGFWYQIHIWNMPVEVQHRLINESISPHDLANMNAPYYLNIMTDISVLRPYAQYLLGFLMVSAHTTGGHTTYFFGEVGTHWPQYFIFAYLLKEPIAAQILFYFSVMVLFMLIIQKINNRNDKKKGRWIPILRSDSVFLGYAFFAALVFAMASANKLQLGIRYILPVFPFLYLFIAYMLGIFWDQVNKKERPSIYRYANIIVLVLLLGWSIESNIGAFPSYMAYFNELKGGPKEGWKYLVDSNLDWGQDLVRLRDYMNEKDIQNINVDYFGGGNLDYYLGGKYQNWGFDKKPATGWFAISASAIQWNTKNSPERGSYHWLTDNFQPEAQIGYSIFVYHVDQLPSSLQKQK